MTFGKNLKVSKTTKTNFPNFIKNLSTLKFLDPACGCGNFLVITYRELRLLEIEILRALNKSGQRVIDVRDIIWLDVDMMCGIEYEEFPARIAEVAMWLIDHQMNMQISNEFGQYFVRLPLKKAAKIVHGDALETDWENVVSKNELSFILGNPPFIGSKIMKQSQRDQIVKQFDNADGSGVLDYVTGWYIKAAKFIQGYKN
jgi:type I restriction-modification system DNA methylase subunit